MHIKSYDWVTDPQSPNEKIMSPSGVCSVGNVQLVLSA